MPSPDDIMAFVAHCEINPLHFSTFLKPLILPKPTRLLFWRLFSSCNLCNRGRNFFLKMSRRVQSEEYVPSSIQREEIFFRNNNKYPDQPVVSTNWTFEVHGLFLFLS